MKKQYISPFITACEIDSTALLFQASYDVTHSVTGADRDEEIYGTEDDEVEVGARRRRIGITTDYAE